MFTFRYLCEFISDKAERLGRFIVDTSGVKEFKGSSMKVCVFSVLGFLCHISHIPPLRLPSTSVWTRALIALGVSMYLETPLLLQHDYL